MPDEKVIDLGRLSRYHDNLKSNGLPMNDWQANKIYKVGYVVMYNGNQYRCTVEHTSTSTFDTSKWELTSSPGGVDLPEWQPNTSYTAGKYLVHEGTVYKVDNDFTSGTTFSDNDLTAYIAPIMQGATSSADGKAGMVIKPTTTDVDKFLKGDGTWGSAGGGISIWQANTAYNVNDVVIDSNLIWQCAIAHTSTTTFDESKWVCISGGEISNGYEIVSLWEGEFSYSNSTQSVAPTSSTPMVTLSESMDNFEYLYIVCKNSIDNFSSVLIPVEDISLSGSSFRAVVYATGSFCVSAEVKRYDSTHFYISYRDVFGWSEGYLTSIQGIRKAKPIVSSGMKYETLWEGEAGDYSGSFNITIPISEPITKYKKLGLNICISNGNANANYYRELDVNVIMGIINSSSGIYTMNNGYSNTDDYIDILSSSSISQLVINGNKSKVTKIIGISEGVQIPTGVQAARVTLWEGAYDTSNQSSTVLTNTLQISDSIENYDCLEFTINGYSTSTEENYITSVVRVDSITYNKPSFRLDGGFQNNYYSVLCTFTDSTHFAICWENSDGNWVNGKLAKIVGIKYIQPDSYSTEEKLIGTWIDGKPLYRKVFTGTAPSSAGVNTNIFTDSLFTNVDMCYVKDGYIKYVDGGGYIDFYKINESRDSDYSSRIFISGSESSIRGAVGSQFTSRPLVVIVEYTKN